MASKREYEMLFQLNAQLGGSYSSTFKSAQREIVAMQKEIDSLSKTQSDISAYQKQQSAVEATRQKLSVLQQQYDNIQKEISETGEFSADLQNKLLSKQLQIDKTSSSLDNATQKLNQMGAALKEAGVDTSDLGKKSSDLGGKIDELKKKQEDVADGADNFGSKASQAFISVHEALVAAGVAKALKEIYDAFMACLDASVEFESVMTGVSKTTDMSDSELSAMSDSIKELSTEIPVTTSELGAVAETAGQLGIAKDDLLDFSTVMAELGTATNMTSDEAATMLAQFANITQMDPSYYDELGSTIVDLGNNFATTEQRITEMAQGIAASGSLAGMSEADMAGLSAAVSSLGIETQMGSTSISTLISTLMTAVETGEDLDEYARIANMSADEFSKAWGEDAAGALASFVTGLSDTSRIGSSAIVTLNDLGITETRMQRTILSLSNSGDLLTNAISDANQAWSDNTALTTEAGKRYATTASQQTMMKDAYNNLKIAVGDNYTPVLQKLYAVEKDVLKGLTSFVEENPALVKAVGAFFAVLGTVIAALAAYTVAAKVAIAFSAAFATVTGAALWPILAVTGAIAGITAGIVALVSAANEGIPSVKELTEASRAMSETMDTATDTYNDTVTATLAAYNVADTYIDKLEEMQAAGINTNEEHKQYHNTLALLCQVVPELADSIDLETDTITGGTDALRANTEAWKQNAMQQAYQDQLTELYKSYSAVLVEAEENSIGLTKAQYDLDAANQKYSDTVNKMDSLYAEAATKAAEYNKEYSGMTDATNFLTQEYYDLENSLYDVNDEIYTAEKSAKNYQKAIDEDKESTEEAKEQIDLATEAVNNLMEATGEGADATAESAQQEKDLQAVIADVTSQMTQLSDAYAKAYDAAYESVSGQYDLWDEADKVVATSAGSINAALESQVTYWQNYNANLQALSDRSADIAGLSDVIASFADGSADSVNAIAGMAGASDEQLRAMVDNWKALQTEQSNASGSIADLKTDFTTTMNELQKELASDIDAMDLGAEAADSGKATIQGFINGATGLLPQVQAAYARVAQAAKNALSTGAGGTAGEIPGYAVGTQSAAPGFALVGENGPELVYFNGGEQVMTAEETEAAKNGYSASDLQAVAFSPRLLEYMAAMRGANSASADAGRGGESGGSSSLPPIQVVFQISGNASPSVVEELRKYGNEFSQMVLQVVEDANIDAARRAYR